MPSSQLTLSQLSTQLLPGAENEQDQVSPFANLLTSNNLTASSGRMGRAQALLIPLQVGR